MHGVSVSARVRVRRRCGQKGRTGPQPNAKSRRRSLRAFASTSLRRRTTNKQTPNPALKQSKLAKRTHWFPNGQQWLCRGRRKIHFDGHGGSNIQECKHTQTNLSTDETITGASPKDETLFKAQTNLSTEETITGASAQDETLFKAGDGPQIKFQNDLPTACGQ